MIQWIDELPREQIFLTLNKPTCYLGNIRIIMFTIILIKDCLKKSFNFNIFFLFLNYQITSPIYMWYEHITVGTALLCCSRAEWQCRQFNINPIEFPIKAVQVIPADETTQHHYHMPQTRYSAIGRHTWQRGNYNPSGRCRPPRRSKRPRRLEREASLELWYVGEVLAAGNSVELGFWWTRPRKELIVNV